MVYGAALLALGSLFVLTPALDFGRDGEPARSTPTMIWIGVAFLGIGGALCLFAWHRAHGAMAILNSGLPAEAVITAIHYVSSSSDSELFRQVEYRYESSRGQMHKGKSGWLTPEETRGWNVGTRGTIKFNPANPAQSVWIGLPAGNERPPSPGRSSFDRSRAMSASPLADPAVKEAARRAGNPFRLGSQSLYMKSAAFVAIYLAITGFFAALALSGGGVASGSSLDRQIYALVPLVLLVVFLRKIVAGVGEVRSLRQILRDGIPVEGTVIRVDRIRIGRRLLISGWIVSYGYRDPSRNDREGRSGYLSKREAERWNPGDKCIVFVARGDARKSVWIGAKGA